MADLYNLGEHAGVLIVIISGAMTLLWALLFTLRRADVRRIDIHREHLDRIEDKLEKVAANIVLVTAFIPSAEKKFDHIDASLDCLKRGQDEIRGTLVRHEVDLEMIKERHKAYDKKNGVPGA